MDDVSKFAFGLGNEVSEFRKGYLSQDTDNPAKHMFIELPCPFLANNKCSNYDCRPKDCRSYPHLHKKDFVFRLWGVIENYEVCPIVFNVYEQLKTELWVNDSFENDDFDFEWE
jgi:hypothetical protein